MIPCEKHREVSSLVVEDGLSSFLPSIGPLCGTTPTAQTASTRTDGKRSSAVVIVESTAGYLDSAVTRSPGRRELVVGEPSVLCRHNRVICSTFFFFF